MPRWLRWAVALVALVAGVALVWTNRPVPAPEPPVYPSAPISVASPTPSGPTSAKVVVPDSIGRRSSPTGSQSPTTTTSSAPEVPGSTPGEQVEGFGPDDMAPSTLFIPAIGSYSPVDASGFDEDDQLVLDPDPTVLSRWSGSAPMVSEKGNTLLAGHVSYNGQRGTLYRLGSLTPGSIAYTRDDSGRVQRFILSSLVLHDKSTLPASVWDNSPSGRRLTVITCGGPVTQTSHGRHYRDNLVAIFVEG